MRRLGIPETRQNFIDIAYPDNLPDEWTSEHEQALPEHLQDPSQFK